MKEFITIALSEDSIDEFLAKEIESFRYYLVQEVQTQSHLLANQLNDLHRHEGGAYVSDQMIHVLKDSITVEENGEGHLVLSYYTQREVNGTDASEWEDVEVAFTIVPESKELRLCFPQK